MEQIALQNRNDVRTASIGAADAAPSRQRGDCITVGHVASGQEPPSEKTSDQGVRSFTSNDTSRKINSNKETNNPTSKSNPSVSENSSSADASGVQIRITDHPESSPWGFYDREHDRPKTFPLGTLLRPPVQRQAVGPRAPGAGHLKPSSDAQITLNDDFSLDIFSTKSNKKKRGLAVRKSKTDGSLLCAKETAWQL